MKKRKTFPVRKLSTLAILIALEVVLSRFCSINTAGWKIGFGFVPVAIAGILYGPVSGAIVGGLSDFIGAILFPIGPYFPGFTICAAMIGAVYGCFLSRCKKINYFFNIVLPTFINSILIGLCINTIWVSILYHSKNYLGWFIYRLPEYAILIPVNLILLPLLVKLCGRLGNKVTSKVNNDHEKMTYDEALAFIHSVSWKGSRPGLSRITALCQMLGNPEKKLRFIHIAGTNGKGSVSEMLSSILRESGYRVGLFTSPYIESFNERMQVNGCEITNEELAEITSEVKPYALSMEDSPTEFELITAIGFLYFLKNNCDFVVLECGMGGRYDSTNVIETSELSIITGIDLDHTALLGNTTAKIAWEKAGIIKQGVPVIFGEGDDSAMNVIRQEAEGHGSRFIRTDFSKIHDVHASLDGTSFIFDNVAVHINLHGIYQTRNTATVLTAVNILRERNISISDAAVLKGLDSAVWKARFEILSEEPLIVYDGAHNPQGIRAAVENIEHYLSPLTENGKVLLLMGVLADKDYKTMIDTLAPLTDAVYTVMPKNDRSLDSEGTANEFKSHGVNATPYELLEDGVFAAVREAQKRKMPLVCLGSLYLYADVKQTILKALSE